MSLIKRIWKLAPSQKAKLFEIISKWEAIGRSTEPADRERAERAICGLYKLAGLTKPHVVWLPCPLSGALSALVYASLIAKGVFPSQTGPISSNWPVRSAVESAVMSTIESEVTVDLAVASAVGSAVHSAVDSALRHWNEVDSDIGFTVDSAVRSAFMSAVASAQLEVDSVVRSAVELAVLRAVNPNAPGWPSSIFSWRTRPSVYPDAVELAVDSAVHIAAKSLVEFAVDSSGVNFTPRLVLRLALSSHDEGSLWRRYPAWADFFSEVLSTSVDRNYLELVESCGYVWMLDGICFVSERPSKINLDDRGRLHSETGQSIGYPSGWGLWHWHGVQVPRSIIEQPETITVTRIRERVNVEVRRVMVERYGQARYLVDSGAKSIHSDEVGELYYADVPGDEPLVMVKVLNSTLEPDGSRKPYFLRVHPECRPLLANGELGEPQAMTATAAVASTFGMTAGEYVKHLIAQT